MFAGLAIFFILTWKTREFDLNFAYQKFYFLLKQLVFLCFGNENAILYIVQLQYIVHFVDPNTWMLTFNVVLGYQGPTIPCLLVNFFLGFFFSIWPTDPISENAFDSKRKKRGEWP